MSEIKSAMLLMIFFVGILFPGILQFGIDSLNQNAFTKNTKEFTELVQEEAGLTAKSKEVKARLEGKGYVVQLTDQKGHTVTGTVPYGDTIHLAYEYTFKSVFKERVLKSTNTALVTKRDEKTSTGGGVPVKPGGEEQAQGKVQTKTVSLLSNESKNATQTQTFTIDNLGKVKRISSDTGNVEIQSINGNEVTVKMTGGATSRQVQTGGKYVEGESKYVTNQMNQVYKDQDGFEGVLNKYVSSGYLMQGREKYVTAQYGKFYRDAEGYEGDLAAYLYSGELKPGGSKYVTGQTSPNYSDSQGYSGNLSRYVYSGSYIAEDSKYVTDYPKPDYTDEEGYKGKLTRYLVSGEENKNKAEFFNGKLKPIKELTAGTTVELNGKQYIIIDPNKGYLWMNENYSTGRAFDTRAKEYSATPFDPNSSSNIAYYLNNTFFKSLPPKYQVAIQTHNWGTGHHTNERATTASAKIGLISYSEFKNISKKYNPKGFLSRINNSSINTYIWSITRDANTIYEKHVHTISPSGYLHESIDPKRGKDSNFTTVIRPAFYIDSSIELKVLEYNEDASNNIPVYRYQGTVIKPSIDTRIYRYQGTVTKPPVDTRVYRYQGVVKQPDVDMREWRYQGTVRKPGMDTRTFDKYYQYNIEITYDVKE